MKTKQIKQTLTNDIVEFQQMRRKAPIGKKDSLEKMFLNQADIICTTLSTGANKALSMLKGDISYLIVDEAC